MYDSLNLEFKSVSEDLGTNRLQLERYAKKVNKKQIRCVCRA